MTRPRFWVPTTAACACVLALTVTAPPVAAQAPSEKAIAIAVGDSALQWAACPPIFPKGCEVAVLHGDPAKGRSDVFFRVPASYTIPPHSHTSAEHMALVSGKLQVTYQGQPEVTLTPGTYAYGPANAPHKAYCANQGPCVLMIVFESPIDAVPFTGSLN